MTLEALETEVEGNRAQAASLQSAYTNEQKRIDADPTLSPAGRTEAKAALSAQYGPKLRDLRAKEEQLIDTTMRNIQTRIEAKSRLTSGTDIIAFRDAQDRADRMEQSDEAINVLRRAMRQGDDPLAHAIFRRATEAGWADVIKAFTAENPELESAVRDLTALQKAKDNAFARTVTYALFGG